MRDDGIQTPMIDSKNGRLRVGLALGGGVARGLAHIGVLSVLEEAGIQVDCVAGTSMGAIIGAGYCAGLEIADLKELAARAGWWQVTRPALSAGGFVTFKRLERFLEEQIGEFDVRDLAIPFAAVASDLVNSERVILDQGRLCTAIRASCSVPGLAPPVELDGRVLVDGGITDNIPADVARMLGADFVIGVDVFTPAHKRYLGPLGQSITAIETLIRHAGQGKDECDCLIIPDLAGQSYFRFSNHVRLIALGEAAARRQLPALLAALNPDRAARTNEPGQGTRQRRPVRQTH